MAHSYYVRAVRSGQLLVISALAPASGVKGGGTTVTISGNGFGSTAGTVSVGGQAAVVSSWSDTAIVSTVAAHALGAVEVAVTTADAKTVSLASGYTYQNAAPIATGSSVTTNEDNAVTGQVTGSDADGDAITFAVATGPTHGTVTVAANGGFIYTPAANYYGADTFAFTASDGQLTTSPATWAVTVNAVNDPPTAQAKGLTAYQGVTMGGQLAASDVEGASLTYTLATSPSHGTATVQTDGSFSYTPAADYSGPDSFTFTVNDGEAASAPAQVTITVLSDPDVDKDGITNDLDPDDDNDGLSDQEEALIGTNPYNADTDGDLLLDAVDPAPLVNHFMGNPKTVYGITSQDAPFPLTLTTLYGDSVDDTPGADRWYSLTVGPDGAGIHYLVVKPLEAMEKTSGAGRLICTIHAQQPDGQLAVVRTSELAATSLQAFRLPLGSGTYLVQVASKELLYDDFQVIALKSDRLYDLTITAKEGGQANQPLVLPASGAYRLYARVEGGALDGKKAVTAGLYAGKITGDPTPEKLIVLLGTAEEFSTPVNLKGGLITLAVSGAETGQVVRLWLDKAGPGAAGVEFEPNQTTVEADSLAVAGATAAGQVGRSGVLSSAGDSDVFGFLVGQADDQTLHSLTISTTLKPGTVPDGAKQQLQFLSASGTPLKKRYVSSSKLDDSVSGDYASGVYYLKFADFTDDQISSTGCAYTLTVSDTSGAITPLPKGEGGAEALSQQST